MPVFGITWKVWAARRFLSAEPLGWKNIENVLRKNMICSGGKKGCFAINSIRDFTILSPKAHEIVSDSKAEFKRLLRMNIEAEQTKLGAEEVAEMVSTFLAGLCVEQNLKVERACSERKR